MSHTTFCKMSELRSLVKPGDQGWVEYCFMSHQFIYVEMDDDNDDETDRNPGLHFKDKGSFTPHIT